MTDDSLDDTQQSSVGKQEDTFKSSKDLIIASVNFHHKFIWNAAIEEAMKRLTLISGVTLANTIKDLKK
jgi:hypothetical protein